MNTNDKGVVDRNTVQVMLELVRSSIQETMPRISPDMVIDWDGLRKKSAEAGVLTWVWDSVTKLPESQQLSRFQKVGWGLSAQTSIDRYYKQKEVLKDLIEVCRQNNIRLMLLKGIGLSEMYPKPELRSSGDLDIFLFDDFEKGNEIFLTDSPAETDLHVSFDYKGVHVENHKLFVYPNTKTKKAVCAYLMRRLESVELKSSGYYVLSSIDNFIYLIMHAMNHVNFNEESPFLGMRNIIDLTMYLRHYHEIWNPGEVKALIQKVKLGKPYDFVVYIAEIYWEEPLTEYHLGRIRRRDAIAIHEMFWEKGFCEEISNNDSWIKQLYQRLHRYGRLMRIYKYMPKHKDSFIYSVIRDQLRSMGFRRKINRGRK